MRSALVEDGIVRDITLGEMEGAITCPDFVCIGWSFDGESFTPPPPTEEEIENAAAAARKAEFPNLYPDQFWFGLRAAGYEDDVRDWVAGLKETDPITWAWASAKLEFATYFERDHPLVESFRIASGMSEQELDALWSFAAQ